MSEYAAAGVDYSKIHPFKAAMQEVARRTRAFPMPRGVVVEAHASFRYNTRPSCAWRSVTEGLGSKSWIAEWMYQQTGDPRYFSGIWIDTVMMAVVDLIRVGALPVIYTDQVAARTSEWFDDEPRRAALAESLFEACRISRMALVGGESSALRCLIKAEPPVSDAAVLSGCAIGIITPPSREVTGSRLHAGAVILGARSSGVHANGISLLIKKGLGLRDGFLHELPHGKTLGEEVLTPSASYVALVEALLHADVDLLAMVPITGGGLARFADAGERWLTAVIECWPPKPLPIFQFLLESGVPIEECLATYNWGIGFAIFVRGAEADRTAAIARRVGCPLVYLGQVENGPRRTRIKAHAIADLHCDLELAPHGA